MCGHHVLGTGTSREWAASAGETKGNPCACKTNNKGQDTRGRMGKSMGKVTVMSLVMSSPTSACKKGRADGKQKG